MVPGLLIVPLDSDKRDHMNAPKGVRPGPPASPPLTARKREVLEHLLRGASEPTVARAMGLSVNTVHSHVKAIYREFRVNGRWRLQAMLLSPQHAARREGSLAARVRAIGEALGGVVPEANFAHCANVIGRKARSTRAQGTAGC
jgi:DNA-binding CsgD family transcriptional regulator